MPNPHDLIREAIELARRFGGDELFQVRSHVAAQPFEARPLRLSRDLIGLRSLAGEVLTPGSVLSSFEQHLIKRVQLDGQWPAETTLVRYLADLRAAVRHDRGDVWTYRYQGQDYVGFLAPNDYTEPAPQDEPFVWVAYSAAFGVIRTGYKTAGFHRVFPSGPPERLIRHTG